MSAKPVPDKTDQILDLLRQILHASHSSETKLNDILESLNDIESEVLQMAATQADLDAKLDTQAQAIADLLSAVAKLPGPVDLSAEIAKVDADIASIQQATASIKAITG